MTKLTMSGVVREILTADINLKADEVIDLARSQGLRASDTSIRDTVYNVRAELNKKARAKTAPAATRETTPPKVPAPAAALAASTPAAIPAAPTELSAVLANVALVNAIVGRCGGVENARGVAEAVRSCGGADAFLQHLDLVASIRVAGAPG